MVEPGTEESNERHVVVARRSARIGRLMVVGVVVFVVVAAIVTYSFPVQKDVDRNAVFGLVALFSAAVGAAVGGIVGLILDRAARRKAATVEIERIHVKETDEPIEIESTREDASTLEAPTSTRDGERPES